MIEIIKSKPYSDHPNDRPLTVVLAKNYKGEFVTWIHNSKDGGFFWGHYFKDDLAAATRSFEKRPD